MSRPAHPFASPLALAVTVAALVLSVGLGPALPRASAASISDSRLVGRLGRMMADSRVQHATSGAAVMDVSTGSLLYSRNGSTKIIPASNTKLLTAAAAMGRLGPNFRFKTEVVYRAPLRHGTVDGYLYLKGYGDPTSMQSDYAALARQVRARGIRTVTGSLGVDTSYFDSQVYNPGWSKGYADRYYAAQIRPLTIAPTTDYDSGTILLRYRPGAKGKRARLSTVPAAAASAVTIRNLTSTGTRSTSVSVSRSYGSRTITVRGSVERGSSGGSSEVAVDHPELVAAAVFRSELHKAGVRVEGSTRLMRIPARWHKVAAVDRSMTLAHLLVPFLKLSNNMHAETLTKTLGAVYGGRGSWSAGLAVTRRYLVSLGVPASGVRLVDGSGLTRSNRITPRSMVTLLTAVHRKSWFAAFDNALPLAADRRRMVGGTLAGRFIGTPAAGNARAKTGSLTGVTALSGYVRGADHRLYAFSMLSQYRSVSPRPVENTLVITLAGWRR